MNNYKVVKWIFFWILKMSSERLKASGAKAASQGKCGRIQEVEVKPKDESSADVLCNIPRRKILPRIQLRVVTRVNDDMCNQSAPIAGTHGALSRHLQSLTTLLVERAWTLSHSMR